MTPTLAVPFHQPSIGPEEIDAVAATLRSGWLTTGPRTAEFEHEFRLTTGAAHALAVNSCTAGLHLALAALNLRRGEEVITTPLTFCATVNVILHTGATPVLADIGPDGNLDPTSAADRITPRTRALLPVHFAGLPCDLGAIWELARRRRLHVVEDCAHALGASYAGQPIGSGLSDAAAFSFYATKNITTGEGGMVTTPHPALAARLRTLALHGLSRDAWNRYSTNGRWFYEVLEPGFKYNLSDLQSALGLAQLRKLSLFMETRHRYVRLYDELLGDAEEWELPPRRPGVTHAWHLYVLRLRLDRLRISRAEFIQRLESHGIGASVHFIPIPLHPFFRRYARRPCNACPNALKLYPRLVSLPLYPAMTEEQIVYVAETARAIARAERKPRPIAVSASA